MHKRQIVYTTYVRVLKWKAFQVEIHPIKLATSSCQLASTAWFQDSHMQEVLLLLRDIMHERAVLKSKQLDTQKTTKSDILTGSTVRLGYSLKRKQEHQMCLLPAEFSHTSNSETDSGTSRYRSLVLHNEKLVVYIYPLQGSSQQNMIQLLSALRESKPTESQKVSISSYFQKTSPNTKSSQYIKPPCEAFSKSSERTGTAPSQKHLVIEEKPATSADDPGGVRRKRTIKSIIKKSGPKKRKVVKSVIKTSSTEFITKYTSQKQHVHTEHQTSCGDKNVLSNQESKNFKDEAMDQNCAETGQKYCDIVRKNCRTDGDHLCSNIFTKSCEVSVNQHPSDEVLRDRRKNAAGNKKPHSDVCQLELQTAEPDKSLSCSVTSAKACESESRFISFSPEKTAVQRDTRLSFCSDDDADTFASKLTVSPETTSSSNSLQIKSNEGMVGLPLLKTKCLSVKMLRKISKHNSAIKCDIVKNKMAESLGVGEKIIKLKNKKCLRSFSPEKMVTTLKLDDEASSFCARDQTDSFNSKLTTSSEITADSLEMKSNAENFGLKSKCLTVKTLRKIAKHSSSTGDINKDKMTKLSECAKTIIDFENKANYGPLSPEEIGDEVSSCTSDQTDAFMLKPNLFPEITSSNHEGEVGLPLLKSRCLSVRMLKKIAKHNSLLAVDKTVTKLKEQKGVCDSKVYHYPYEFEIQPKKAKTEHSLEQKLIPKKETILNTVKSDDFIKDSDVCDEDSEKLPAIFLKKRDRWKKRLTEIFPLQDMSNDPATNIDDKCELGNSTRKENFDCDSHVYISEDELHVNKDLNSKQGSEVYNTQTEGKNNVAELTKELKQMQTHILQEKGAQHYAAVEGSTVGGALRQTNRAPTAFAVGAVVKFEPCRYKKLYNFTDIGHQEIASMSYMSVDSIQNIQLEKLVFSNETYLRTLFQGQRSCWRHQEYKKGGSSRANLNYCVHFGLFTEEQQDVVMETLMSIFCKKHHKYLDYIMKVLLPEILIKILMEMKDMSHNEADTLLATSRH